MHKDNPREGDGKSERIAVHSSRKPQLIGEHPGTGKTIQMAKLPAVARMVECWASTRQETWMVACRQPRSEERRQDWVVLCLWMQALPLSRSPQGFEAWR